MKHLLTNPSPSFFWQCLWFWCLSYFLYILFCIFRKIDKKAGDSMHFPFIGFSIYLIYSFVLLIFYLLFAKLLRVELSETIIEFLLGELGICGWFFELISPFEFVFLWKSLKICLIFKFSNYSCWSLIYDRVASLYQNFF